MQTNTKFKTKNFRRNVGRKPNPNKIQKPKIPAKKWVNLLKNKLKSRKSVLNNNGLLIKNADPTSISSYMSMVLDEKFKTAVPKPLLSMGRSHIKKICYRTTKTVNSNGRLLMVCPYGLLPRCGTLSTVSPVFCMNSEEYNPSVNTNAITTGSNFDLDIVGTSGIGLVVDNFTAAATIAAHLCVSLSGVSNLNKKGKLYIAESRNGTFALGGSASADISTLYANRYFLGNLVKYFNHSEVEIMNMNSSSRIEYHYIDPYSYANTPTYDPATNTSPTYVFADHKAVVLIVDGAAAGTEVIFDHTIVIQARPEPSYLNTYPTQFTGVFENPDPYMRALESNSKNVLKVDKADDHFNSLPTNFINRQAFLAKNF
jgi:hypothetical protein